MFPDQRITAHAANGHSAAEFTCEGTGWQFFVWSSLWSALVFVFHFHPIKGCFIFYLPLPSAFGFLTRYALTLHVLLQRSGFHLATQPHRPDWWMVEKMVVFLELSPLKGTLELWQCGHQVFGHLPDWGPSPTMAQFRCQPAPEGVLLLQNFFHWQVMEASAHCFCTFPRLAPADNSLRGLQTVLLTSCSVCALTCMLTCGAFYPQNHA